jgi:hypothetical protein
MRELETAAKADLDEVVQRDVSAVREALAAVALTEPAFATCLHYSRDSPDLLDPAAVYVGVESDRERALGVDGALERFCSVWNPMEYTGAEVSPEPSLRDDESYVAREKRLVGALHEAGIDEPARCVLEEVARRLTESPAIQPVTQDHVAFVMDPDFGDDLVESLRGTAPPDVAARLRERGLLPESVDDLTDAL